MDSSTESPVETIELTFRSIQMTYLTQGANGVLTASGVSGWDLSKNAQL